MPVKVLQFRRRAKCVHSSEKVLKAGFPTVEQRDREPNVTASFSVVLDCRRIGRRASRRDPCDQLQVFPSDSDSFLVNAAFFEQDFPQVVRHGVDHFELAEKSGASLAVRPVVFNLGRVEVGPGLMVVDEFRRGSEGQKPVHPLHVPVPMLLTANLVRTAKLLLRLILKHDQLAAHRGVLLNGE